METISRRGRSVAANVRQWSACWLLFAAICPPAAADTSEEAALAASVAELARAVGRWDVVTEFLAPDGSVSRSVDGSYEMAWVVADRVVSGVSEIPELGVSSGLLFYVNENARIIEMVSVGADGKLWVMTGPLGGNVRETPDYLMSDGSTQRLRFTSYNVAQDSFESRMEWSADGGRTWYPGNHQVFRRSAADLPETAPDAEGAEAR